MKVFLAFADSDLPKVKADLLAYLPAMSSGHRLEAFSAGLGFKTYAALKAALSQELLRNEIDPEAFVARVVALGYDPKDLMPSSSIHSTDEGNPEVALEMVFRQVVSPLSLISRDGRWRERREQGGVLSAMQALIDRAEVVFRRFGVKRAEGFPGSRSQEAVGHFHVADNCQNGIYARIFARADYGFDQPPLFEIVPQEQCCDAVEATKDAIEMIEGMAKAMGAVIVFQEIDDVPFLRPHLEAKGYLNHVDGGGPIRGMVVKDFLKVPS